jgi:hypothetical protein
MRGLMGRALVVFACASSAQAATTTPLPVYVVPADEVAADDLTPAGQAAVQEGHRLRRQFLDRLAEMREVVLVTDETRAAARLEIRESAVHHLAGTERTQRQGPKRPAGIQGGAVGERVTDLGIQRV